MGQVVNYNEGLFRCDFCGKTENQVRKLIKGPSSAICDECVSLCVQILASDKANDIQTDNDMVIPVPSQIVAHLDRYVVGQDSAKRTLAVAVYNHYKRINIEREKVLSQMKIDSRPIEPAYATSGVRADRRDGSDQRLGEVEVDKSNILLLGPTGVGKTFLAKSLARVMDVPFVITDATALTEAGYVGDDVEMILQRLLQAANGDIERAQHGIIYIDEIDKIARKSGQNTSITRDVSGEGVQQALLKIIEGTVAKVPTEGSRKQREQESVELDTKGILFICGGAFVGLEDIIQRRLGLHESGFSTTRQQKAIKHDEVLQEVNADDLENFGLLPEFIGRLPVITTLNKLDGEQLKQVLTEPDNALIKQYQRMFLDDGVELSFTDKALEHIAKQALTTGVGARGLRAIIEKTLQKAMFEIPDMEGVDKVVVNEEAVDGQQSLQYLSNIEFDDFVQDERVA
jgi:ATP-dependent Clp protease ATP-binding subunit ClpX